MMRDAAFYVIRLRLADRDHYLLWAMNEPDIVPAYEGRVPLCDDAAQVARSAASIGIECAYMTDDDLVVDVDAALRDCQTLEDRAVCWSNVLAAWNLYKDWRAIDSAQAEAFRALDAESLAEYDAVFYRSRTGQSFFGNPGENESVAFPDRRCVVELLRIGREMVLKSVRRAGRDEAVRWDLRP